MWVKLQQLQNKELKNFLELTQQLVQNLMLTLGQIMKDCLEQMQDLVQWLMLTLGQMVVKKVMIQKTQLEVENKTRKMFLKKQKMMKKWRGKILKTCLTIRVM
ncbi:uncharacterized protein LOC110712226 isoform X1 [Chenopodium quinoa]|uniref:uncharacterized protein LOC110697375 isoform X1 n=1 Tax=Chenopodium quinoa TaxID=63459 RepID=UPI000B78A816|nr:uncharacterized protein LOC110697375 isoform X1 [Chenopodium quinoa]XP_021746379.1 uncharacterized protein LOC110712226 isoform X1 [Chenopodium quinoa]